MPTAGDVQHGPDLANTSLRMTFPIPLSSLWACLHHIRFPGLWDTAASVKNTLMGYRPTFSGLSLSSPKWEPRDSEPHTTSSESSWKYKTKQFFEQYDK